MINDMSCDAFVERLGDLLERDLDEASRAALESHALACSDCGTLLGDLRKLRIDASTLPVLAPSRDLWDGIAQRIDAPVIPLRAGESSFAGSQRNWRRFASMAAAAVLLIAATAISTYYLTINSRLATATRLALATPDRAGDSARPAAGVDRPSALGRRSAQDSADRVEPRKPALRGPEAAPAPTTRLASNARRSAEQVYADEIARLHAIVDRRRSQLDPVTVGVIEQNLKVIDDAIAQCKLALAKDPASRFLMESLNSALETKVELLRTATMLPIRSS